MLTTLPQSCAVFMKSWKLNFPLGHTRPVTGLLYLIPTADMRRLTTGIRSEKCLVRRLCRCANVIESIYTNLDKRGD